MRRVGGDLELLKELAALFLESCPERLPDLRTAVERGDSKALEQVAHALKGAVGNFAATAAFEAALRLEEMGRAGDLTGAEAALARMEMEMERLTEALMALESERPA